MKRVVERNARGREAQPMSQIGASGMSLAATVAALVVWMIHAVGLGCWRKMTRDA
jgi:hypothetical protein